jgi:hypothetical protein
MVGSLSGPHHQKMIDGLKQSAVAPDDAVTQNVKDRVQDRSELMLAQAAHFRHKPKMRRHNCPFRIRQIA